MIRLLFILAPAVLFSAAILAFALLLGHAVRAATLPAAITFIFFCGIGWVATTARPERGETSQ